MLHMFPGLNAPVYDINWNNIRKIVIVNLSDTTELALTNPWYIYRNDTFELPYNTVTTICMCNEDFRHAASRVFTRLICDNQHYLQTLNNPHSGNTVNFLVHSRATHMPHTLLETTVAHIISTRNLKDDIDQLPTILQQELTRILRIGRILQIHVGYRFTPVVHTSCICNDNRIMSEKIRFLRIADSASPF